MDSGLDSPLSSDESGNEGNGGNAVSLLHYTKVFEEQFPFYLSIGMSREEYWDEDPMLVIPYRKAYQLKQKRENYSAWLQGLYFYDALTRVAPIMNAFAKSGTHTEPYPDEPYPFSEEEKKERERREEEKIRREQLEYFKTMIAGINKGKENG